MTRRWPDLKHPLPPVPFVGRIFAVIVIAAVVLGVLSRL